MSSVVIAGNTSGTITVSAPAVAGSNTITLPASTGIAVVTPTGTVAGGQLQTELFTAPGTWTKPSSATQVRVTVIGGGGGANNPNAPGSTGSTGGTSSFGALVSATGGTGSTWPGAGPTVQGISGAGTVTTGTSLLTGAVSSYVISPVPAISVIYNSEISIGVIKGNMVNATSSPAATGISYSTSLGTIAGTGGGVSGPVALPTSGRAGFGGVAIAICPVSAPVSITIGSGGNAGPGPAAAVAGIGGAVLVEYVG